MVILEQAIVDAREIFVIDHFGLRPLFVLMHYYKTMHLKIR